MNDWTVEIMKEIIHETCLLETDIRLFRGRLGKTFSLVMPISFTVSRDRSFKLLYF
jgi:hypothetical protein